MVATMPDPETIAEHLRAERQWREDVLATLIAIQGYAQASAEAAHAQLAALAEIRDMLRTPAREPEPGEPADPSEEPLTVAELLESIADDLTAAATNAGFLTDEPDEPGA